MPDFTQWTVPTPFTNVLFNPMAVDKAIADNQSTLGNLDINRQKLALEQAREADAMAGGKRLIDPSLTGNIDGHAIGGCHAVRAEDGTGRGRQRSIRGQ